MARPLAASLLGWSALFCGIGAAQNLAVCPLSLTQGTPGAVEVSLTNQDGRDLVALQWDIEIPSRLLAPGAQVQPGPAATDAGKNVYCVGRWDKAMVTYSYRCIIAGGNQPLHDGVIATISVLSAPGIKGSKPVRIQRARGVQTNLSAVSLKTSSSSITIRD